ncbi:MULTISPECIES: DUF736 family protein [Leptospira]|uniref:PF05284 family protein n=2 Tax=Leptospira borgpetersenii TaxID=174 RepID=M3GA71_LEPBO|nr:MULTISPECIES: DUF736 family protein [Leptospira]EKP11575.1 PF05284 family protein [Leptospira borgpetersenii str. 200801926]EMF97801.1 PF05284 family protein [Leptospira borgpetersenii str. 200701203]EMK10143.1 PF05284 family protein [Leptospira sp. serovar Kenya str. Sh9]ENO62825.1 PF05284 family protein [Leptospira borgpetersenii serovar Mini str. 201000851]
MSKTLGFMEEKTDKKGNRFYNLEINLPFSPKMEFFAADNAKKNSPEAKDSAPDYLVYYAKNQVGAIWKKTSKTGSKEYLSCEIIAPLSSQGKLNFSLFPDRETEGRFNVSYSEPTEKREVPF